MCNQFSKEFYQEYVLLRDEVNALNNQKISWDYLSHRPEENQKFDDYSYRARRNAIASVVFQALAVESLINLYGTYKLGDKFNKEFERKPTLKKLCLLCKEITQKEFPIKDSLYAGLEDLFNKRNDLVHYKAHSIDSRESSDEEFEEFMGKSVAYVFSDIEKNVGLYDSLKNKLQELEGIDYDFIQLQMGKMYEEYTATLEESLKFILGEKTQNTD